MDFYHLRDDMKNNGSKKTIYQVANILLTKIWGLKLQFRFMWLQWCKYCWKMGIGLTAAAANENDKTEKNFVLKNNSPFRSCISNIKSTLIHSAEDLDIAMSMYI